MTLINKSFLLALILLSGCASVIDGKSEDIAVNTTPAGASCALVRNNQNLASISPTPGSTHIEKTKDDITITCSKPGYEDATHIDKSGIDNATWGNIALGGLIGWGFDSAEGADNYYETPVNITLPKK